MAAHIGGDDVALLGIFNTHRRECKNDGLADLGERTDDDLFEKRGRAP